MFCGEDILDFLGCDCERIWTITCVFLDGRSYPKQGADICSPDVPSLPSAVCLNRRMGSRPCRVETPQAKSNSALFL